MTSERSDASELSPEQSAPVAAGVSDADLSLAVPAQAGPVGAGASPDLMVRAMNQNHLLQGGKSYRVGRDPESDIAINDPRVSDVALKEKRKLILVPRETPLNLIHVRNFELLIQAGAMILPANPSFYTRPQSVQEVADTVVARVLDHLQVPHNLVPRWREEAE